IVRRIDDLGRVVIPKEIRRTMRIREGDPLEIFTDRDGEVIFKKYSPIGELSGFAGQYAETLYRTCNYPILICDRDAVVAFAGLSKKECADKKLSSDMENVMENRSLYVRERNSKNLFALDGNEKIIVSCAMPVISEGDIIGIVMSVIPDDQDSYPGDVETKLIQTAAVFLGKQME
ncbi:MAG: AbrB/MazE/SpoVT family DNA-binding domain-containing protein, partial [Clostridia bacterium]|nr:AbrB/MazE/SpoVT family DNA-binding domain-containing protein [Clostridia bacterium]